MTLPLQILKLLRVADGLLTPEEQLRSDLRLTVTPPPTGSEMSIAFNFLEEGPQPLAISVRDRLAHTVRWKITDAGTAALSERGI